MKKSILAIVIAVVAVGGVTAAVLANNKKDNKTSSSDTSKSSHMDMGDKNSDSSTATATDKVSIKNFAFSPANITVKKGTTVTWTNNDSTDHTVTGDNGGPSSEALSSGGTYQFTFNEVGAFSYHCSIHSSMTGKVTVTE